MEGCTTPTFVPKGICIASFKVLSTYRLSPAERRLRHIHVNYQLLRELQIGVPRSGGEACWTVARVPGLASSRLPSCCSQWGGRREDDSSILDTNPFLRALPSWLYLTQISSQGLISKHHPTVGSSAHSRALVPTDIEQGSSPCAMGHGQYK